MAPPQNAGGKDSPLAVSSNTRIAMPLALLAGMLGCGYMAGQAVEKLNNEVALTNVNLKQTNQNLENLEDAVSKLGDGVVTKDELRVILAELKALNPELQMPPARE